MANLFKTLFLSSPDHCQIMQCFWQYPSQQIKKRIGKTY